MEPAGFRAISRRSAQRHRRLLTYRANASTLQGSQRCRGAAFAFPPADSVASKIVCDPCQRRPPESARGPRNRSHHFAWPPASGSLPSGEPSPNRPSEPRPQARLRHLQAGSHRSTGDLQLAHARSTRFSTTGQRAAPATTQWLPTSRSPAIR
jgi:hypothetical protein